MIISPFTNFGMECLQVLAQFTEMTSRYAQEMQAVSLSCEKFVYALYEELVLGKYMVSKIH